MKVTTQQAVAEQKRIRKLIRQLRALIIRTAQAESIRTGKSAARFQIAAAELAGAASDLVYKLIEDEQAIRRGNCKNMIMARPLFSSALAPMPACEYAESRARTPDPSECCGVCKPKRAKGD